MSFGADEEILQDFLVEAGEILEQLSEQLVELESRPDDADLLNAIFRGFHTVKGGAGFLQLNELVECCHIAENVFDILRKGERRVDSELMDVVLEALDAVNSMFSEVRERGPITAATPELLAALARLAEPQSADEAAPVAQVVEAPAAESESGDITDNEFEQLLDSLNAVKAQAEAPTTVLQCLPAMPPPATKSPMPSSSRCSTSCTVKASLLSMQWHRLPLPRRRLRKPRATAPTLLTTNSKHSSISCTARVTLPSTRWNRPSLR
jgi:two-component system chemotaxis sensor kinase CheA